MVFSPERLDCVAGAIIDKSAPFFQERPTPELHHGIVLALDAFPDVTAEERADYARLVAEAQDRLAPERRASLRVPDVAPDAVTIPSYAAIWRAVLGHVDFGEHLAGPTKSGHTTLGHSA